MSRRIYTGDQNDGTSLGGSPLDPTGFYAAATPIPQRANPAQCPIVPSQGGQIVTYQQTLSPASVAINTAAEQALTVGTTAGNGPLSSDFVAAISKPTTQPGLMVGTARVTANTINTMFANVTGTVITPTASEVYNVVVLRNMPVHSQTLTPAAVPASGVAAVGTTMEQIFSLTPITAVGTAVVNNAGQVTGVTITTAGSNYTCPPTVVFFDPNSTPLAPLGQNTTPPLTYNPQNPATGKGATGIVTMTSGTITGVTITNGGSGYTQSSPPTVSFIGGNAISVGMALMVNKPTAQAGLAIGGCRVVANNQIAITYVNASSAAITPASEAYQVVGLCAVPSINHVTSYGVVATAIASVASITSTEQSVTVNGLLATDICMGISKPSLQTGIMVGTGRCTANALYVPIINATQAAVTPTITEVYGVTVLSQKPVAPFAVLNTTLTPVSVAAQTAAEQQFTVTPVPFTVAPSSVIVNKPSFQSGLAIGNVRVSAANTLQIEYVNVTAAALTPATETYTIGVFNGIPPISGAPGGWIALNARASYAQLFNLVNEFQQATANSGTGLIKGSA